MPACVIKSCKNNTLKDKKIDGITFHLFPADPVILNKWIDLIRRSRQEVDWRPGKRTVICSDHFDSEDFYITKNGLRRILRGSMPKKALWLYNDCSCVSNELQSNDKIFVLNTMKKDGIQICGNRTEPSTSFSNSHNETRQTTLSRDFLDIESIFGTPKNLFLKKQLQKKTNLQIKHVRLIKRLREKNRRWEHRIKKLKQIIKTLKHHQYTDSNSYNVLYKNTFASDLYNNLNTKRLETRKKSMSKYTAEIRKFCLTLNFYSPLAYRYVRSKFNSCLPHPKTLAKWYENIRRFTRS